MGGWRWDYALWLKEEDKGFEETNVTLGFDYQTCDTSNYLEIGQLDVVMLWEKGREV